MIEARSLRRLAIGAMVALLLAGCGDDATVEEGPRAASEIGADAVLVFEPADGGDPVEARVAVAETPEQRGQGLMGVEEMADDEGMVFLHEEPTTSGFWMKNTLIPLSLAVWDETGTILSILDMEPCEEDPCPTYDPGVAWIGAVEVNQGFFERHGIEEGDTTRLER